MDVSPWHLDGLWPRNVLQWRWHFTLRPEDQQKFAKGKWGVEWRTKCSRKGEQAVHIGDIRARPPGTELLLKVQQGLGVVVIMWESTSSCCSSWFYSQTQTFVCYSLFYLHYLTWYSPGTLWGKCCSSISQMRSPRPGNVTSLRKSVLCLPSSFTLHCGLRRSHLKGSDIHTLMTLGQKVSVAPQEGDGGNRHWISAICRIIKHAGAKADRPGLKCQICHKLAAVWTWTSYLTGSEAIPLRFDPSSSSLPSRGGASLLQRLTQCQDGGGRQCLSSDAWYHWDSHWPCLHGPCRPSRSLLPRSHWRFGNLVWVCLWYSQQPFRSGDLLLPRKQNQASFWSGDPTTTTTTTKELYFCS